MAIKRILSDILRALRLCGFDVINFLNLRHYPRYQRDLRHWQRKGGATTHKYPILTDFSDQAGAASGHYFHQDLLVATRIAESKPERHIDVGSRIDGFVAHVASFRRIEILDRRALKSTGHPNIVYTQADITDPTSTYGITTDSLSCLSVIEHLGLGRYGDTIDPHGHIRGFKNLVQLLELGGTMYLSFPIGETTEVHFNAHRVFHPHDIFAWSTEMKSLELIQFDYVDDVGELHQRVDLINSQVKCTFGCGIYTFRRVKA